MRRDNTPRLALVGLLTWFSQHQQQEQRPVLVVVASPSFQHRVRTARRKVPYRHVIDRKQRCALRNAVVYGGRVSTDENYNDVEFQLITETHHDPHDHGTVWVFHASSKRSNRRRRKLQQQQQGQKQQQQQEGGGSQNAFNGHFRRLFDQFFGVEPVPGAENRTFTNVTAQVEFEAVVDPAVVGGAVNSGNQSGSVVHSNSSVIPTNATYGNGTIAVNITESVVYTTTTEGNGTMADQPQFQPLRIRAILAEETGNGNLVNETERNILFHDLLSPAILAWSSSLRVDPVVGNLTVDPQQLLDGQTCGPGIDSGLPSVRVPLEHMERGVPETDVLVYLSLGFTLPPPVFPNVSDASDNDDDGNYPRGRYGLRGDLPGIFDADLGGWTRDRWGQRRLAEMDDENSTYPPSDLTDPWDGSDHGYNSDMNETGLPEAINICTGEYLAAASYCSTDQMDRPVAALLHICIDESFFDPQNRERNVRTLVHELGHALGFNSLSMAHFRRPDGTPYTERDEDGEVPLKTIECTGPGTERQFATVALPSEEILQFRQVRGGVRVAEVVLPSVVQVVRNQFDCQLLTGAELESGEGLPLSVTGDEGCLGDHWERRLFLSDVMNPVVNDIENSTRISTLTLAYFADSGWYQVDLSNADVASGWGRGSGCQFVNDTCINEYGEVPPQNAPFFCNEIPIPGLASGAQDIHGCTPDLSRKAKCSIGQYDLDLPEAFQYFNSTYGSDVGGSDPFMDFCPVYSGFDNGLCSSTDNIQAVKAFDIERFGERNSRCLVGNVLPFQQNSALCLPIACVIEDRSLRVKIEDKWHICEKADQSIAFGSVTIVCPDPRRICPTFFCPYDCLGTGGRCNYTSGKCLCELNHTEVDGEMGWNSCGMVEEVEEVESSTLRPFLRPSEPEKHDPAVPPPGTTLNDYYVADVSKLEGKPLIMNAWTISFVAVGGLVIFSLITTLFMVRKKKESESSCSLFGCWNTRTVEDDSPQTVQRNRQKDKMVATVLVDMRIHENERNLNESLAETEDRLTESDVASGPRSESMSEMSSRRSETMSDVDASQDDMEENLAAAAADVAAEPQIIRRRRIFPYLHFSSS